jgi:hypothetical protein
MKWRADTSHSPAEPMQAGGMEPGENEQSDDQQGGMGGGRK